MSNPHLTPLNYGRIASIRPLIAFIEKTISIPLELKTMLAEGATRQVFAKNKYIVDFAERQDRYVFIVNGTLRGVIGKGSTEITTWIATEPALIFSLREADAQDDTFREFIQAVEKTEVISISQETIALILTHFPQMGVIARKAVSDYCRLTRERSMMIRIPLAEQRYERVLETHPEYFQRLPLRILSSYMGMRMETLSRMRSKAAMY